MLMCAGLALTLGVPADAWAQSRRDQRSQDQDAARPDQDELERREEERNQQLLRAAEARNQAVRTAQRGNGADENGGADARTVGSLIDEQGMISIDFSGPVELSAFLDYVSRALGLTLRSTTIPSSAITFFAPVRIPADRLLPLTRSILEDNGLALVEDERTGTYVVRQLTSIPVSTSTTRIFPTPLLSPSTLQVAVSQQLGGAAAGAGAPRYTPMDDVGVLIVTATPRSLETIQQLIDRITGEIAAQRLVSFDIEELSAIFVRERILALSGEGALRTQGVGGQPQPGGAAAGGVNGSFSNIGSRLFVDAGNRLLFRGTEEEAEMLRELIEIVDRVSTLRVERYIVGVSAAQIARTGSELGLGPVNQISQGAEGQQGRGFGNQPTRSASGNNQTTTPSSSQFILDVDTGSFLYYGTEGQHAQVRELVDEFEKTDLGDTIEIRVYRLEYASVLGGETEDDIDVGVEEILTSLLETASDGNNESPFLPSSRGGTAGSGLTPDIIAEIAAGSSDGGAGAIAQLANPGADSGGTRLIATSENTQIVGDPARNQLFIKAPVKAHEQFERIIRDLDKRLPQVMLEIQIVALVTNDSFDFEADVQLNAGQFTFLSSFGLTSAPDGGDPFAPRNLNLGNAGLTSAVIDSDFLPVAIRALESVGTTETLSRPTLLALDNTRAEYESTSQVPFSATTQGTATTVTSQGGVAEAGTTIRVTPRIGSGGFVTLADLEISLSTFTGEAQDGLQPPEQEDRYDSSVTLPTDSTIIVGGFTLDVDTETVRKVPLLGDIPLIGLLFQDISETKNSTQIFFFITPRIMSDPDATDLRLLSEGPLREAGLDPDVPELEFVSIPVRGRLPETRALPRNEISTTPQASEASE